MLSDMCSTNHNEKSQQSFVTVFSRQLHVLEIMCWKLVFDVLLCICINDCSISMAYVCFECNYCKGKYQTLRAYQCHSRHQRSVGTPYSDPRSQHTISFTERGNLSTGILHGNPSAYLGNAIHTTLQCCVMKAPMFQHNGHNNPNNCNNRNDLQ